MTVGFPGPALGRLTQGGTMLCEACRTVRKGSRPCSTGPVPVAERLAEVLCEACGELLPPRDATDLYLRRLSRLAAFGLAGGADPILKP